MAKEAQQYEKCGERKRQSKEKGGDVLLKCVSGEWAMVSQLGFGLIHTIL